MCVGNDNERMQFLSAFIMLYLFNKASWFLRTSARFSILMIILSGAN